MISVSFNSDRKEIEAELSFTQLMKSLLFENLIESLLAKR